MNNLEKSIDVKEVIKKNMKSIRIKFDEDQCCIIVHHNGLSSNKFVVKKGIITGTLKPHTSYIIYKSK